MKYSSEIPASPVKKVIAAMHEEMASKKADLQSLHTERTTKDDSMFKAGRTSRRESRNLEWTLIQGVVVPKWLACIN